MLEASFENVFNQRALRPHLPIWRERIAQNFNGDRYGDLERWQSAVAQLPQVSASIIELAQDEIGIGSADDLSANEHHQLKRSLETLMPWRKGPFRLFDVAVDAEWRSDLKWKRIAPALGDLTHKLVLDVGCGNGYFSLRMAGQGAQGVLGIDPSPLFNVQFQALRRYLPNTPVWLAPLRDEDIPRDLAIFDWVVSMGVLHHRKSPLEHLEYLKNATRPGGRVLVESLVVDAPEETVLVPRDRYAKMRNVWFLPSPNMLQRWLERMGFEEIEKVGSPTPTTSEEQRVTEWMHYESLRDFLDPNDPTRTIEGHPAPCRAAFQARRPG